jgi:hypothetical protein
VYTCCYRFDVHVYTYTFTQWKFLDETLEVKPLSHRWNHFKIKLLCILLLDPHKINSLFIAVKFVYIICPCNGFQPGSCPYLNCCQHVTTCMKRNLILWTMCIILLLYICILV